MELFSSSSKYRHRPAVMQCVKERMGDSLVTHMVFKGNQTLPGDSFVKKLVASRAVLSLPGFGYDCYRTWETLMSGYVYLLLPP